MIMIEKREGESDAEVNKRVNYHNYRALVLMLVMVSLPFIGGFWIGILGGLLGFVLLVIYIGLMNWLN